MLKFSDKVLRNCLNPTCAEVVEKSFILELPGFKVINVQN